MRITLDVYNEIKNTVGTYKAETGGIIGMNSSYVSAFAFDKNATTSNCHYWPSAFSLNLIIQDWYCDSICFCGLVHSHEKGNLLLSRDDAEFAQSILGVNSFLNFLFFPIVSTLYDSNEFQIQVYKIFRDSITKDSLSIL